MKRFVFILLAAAFVIMPLATSCSKIEQPSKEEISDSDKDDDDKHPDVGSLFGFHKKHGNNSGDNNGSGSGSGNNNGGSGGGSNGGNGGGSSGNNGGNGGSSGGGSNGGNSGGGNSGGGSGGGSNGGNSGGGNNGGGSGGGNNGGNSGGGNGGGSNGGGNSGGGNSGGGNSGGNNGGNSGGGNNGGNNGGNGGNSEPVSPVANAKVVRTWTVDYCILNVSGGGISIMAGFKGCDIEEMAKMAERNGAEFDVSKVAGYKVTNIELYDNNVLAVNFENKDVFYGNLVINGKNITYTFISGGKDLKDVSASGTMTSPAPKNTVLILSATVKEYSGSIELNLIEV